jgi:transcriptional regulator with XRE-family HTH domain
MKTKEKNMDSKLIGASITSLRQERGWTQRQLARQLDLSHQAVSKWENGESAPDVETLVRLARLFGVTIDRLINPDPADLRRKNFLFSRRSPEKLEEEEELDNQDFDDDADEDGDEDGDENEDEDEEEVEFRGFSGFHRQHTHRHTRHQPSDPKLKLLLQMAPFISREVLDEKFLAYLEKNDLESFSVIESLAPFVSREVLSTAIDKTIEGDIDPTFVLRLAPFINRDDLVRLIEKTTDQAWVMKHLAGLAPFLPKSFLDDLIGGMEF